MSILDDNIIDNIDKKISELSFIRVREFLWSSVPCQDCDIALRINDSKIDHNDKTYSYKGNIYTYYDVCRQTGEITLRDPSKPVLVFLSPHSKLPENERDKRYLKWIKDGLIFPMGQKVHIYKRHNNKPDYEEIIV